MTIERPARSFVLRPSSFVWATMRVSLNFLVRIIGMAVLAYFKSISIAELIAVVFGALIGLLLALLLAVPLAQLPSPFGRFLPIIGSITLAYLGAMVFSARKKEIGGLLKM